ncbi:MAG: cell division protein FtsA [Candidatus Zambryskibacteria bacterium CG_4_9_14_3_um_filter_40_16]|uniref:Cell division protein FtsA n=2 Tax=Candidatus Zambryskiibacteriota TaxID=1817925 RepID=A0A2H0K797_9BACT|nr:MAG: cell division protein FtsA [Candidatus Zambryskibacteria bacterium CG11_big_fil_rev_8_21_14_0_20_40_24]PJA33641.1 MAG: cell division protein FtsA [Candidatus Zambryskibacteria bacterium CG_4_9_14_3_um_filter_40_16]
MARNIAVGIDIGTYQIKIVVAEQVQNDGVISPKILGTGFAESRGLRHGYIVNVPEVTRALKTAIAQASKSAGMKIKKAYISVGGIGLSAITTTGSCVISRADLEITDLDVAKTLEITEEEIPQTLSQNKRIIYSIPIQYKVDGKIVLGNRPLGLKGTKLEAKVLFITSLEHHLKDLVEAVEDAGVDVVDVVASPIAASFVTLTKAQKIAGCVLTNIGSETVSIVVFENNIPISLEVFPIGSTDITNDIALGLRIPLEEAESIKLGGVTSTDFPKRKLDEIVSARLSDMFELIDAHLKKIGRNGLLPAGVIITGGGSSISILEDFAKSSLKLPSRIAHINFPEREKGKIREPFFAVALGLCIIGFNADESDETTVGKLLGHRKNLLAPIKDWLKQFLP